MLYTCGIPIAFAIRSVDPALGLRYTGFSLVYTLSVPQVLLNAGAQGISIALVIQSVDRTLQMYFSIRL